MADLTISPGETLYYEYVPPGDGVTFVFVNALTGNTGMWTSGITDRLHAAGHGSLCYNFRGQEKTSFTETTALTPELVVKDIGFLMKEVAPPRPVLAGLSIGGLFAAQAHLAGAPAEALVLINTLRKPNQRLQWISEAMVRMARVGGGRLVMMANMPVIATPELIAQMWDTTMTDEPLEAPDPSDGLFRLMEGSLATDWDLPYEDLDVPVLLLTGEHDRVFRIDADVAELKGRISNAEEIRYPDAGHLIPLEQPERFVDDLLAFAGKLG